MSLTRKNKKEKVREPRTKITWKEVKRQKVLLFWAAIMVAYGVVFYYQCVMDEKAAIVLQSYDFCAAKLRRRKTQETGGMGYVPYFRGKKACR